MTGLSAALIRWPALCAVAAGGFLATGLPPIHLPIAPLAFAILLCLGNRATSNGKAFLLGWLFGCGFFLAGLYWIAIAFYTDAERFGALAIPAILLLSASLGLITGLVLLGQRLIGAQGIWLQSLSLALLWSLSEIIRGPGFLWFPWNPVASIWANWDWMIQPIAWIGPTLLGFITVLAGALWAPVLSSRHAYRSGVAGLLILAVVGLFGAARLEISVAGDPPGTRLRVVQANVAQHHKWDKDKVRAWFVKHLELSQRPLSEPPDAVIWPESSIPYRPELIGTRRVIRANLPQSTALLAGSDHVVRGDGGLTLHNSLYTLDRHGELGPRYDKVQLVPFGEFLPFRQILTAIGLEKLTPGSVDFLAGPGRHTIDLEGLPAFAALICYEAIFPGMAAPLEDRPAWLVNVTNDAWFGESSGPYQHLVMARMRAIEEGIPLVRAANTGISVITDAFGRIQARLDLGETGVLDADLPGKLDTVPLYRQAPWLITLGGLGLVGGVIGWGLRRSRGAVV